MAVEISTIAAAVKRIEDAKADIIVAINEKSVQVPDTAKITDIADYIGLIQTGSEPTLSLLTMDDIAFDSEAGSLTIPADYKTKELVITLKDIDKDALGKAERDALIAQLASI